MWNVRSTIHLMKTLAAFNKAIDARLLIARLEGSGMAAHPRDENMVTLDWLTSTAMVA